MAYFILFYAKDVNIMHLLTLSLYPQKANVHGCTPLMLCVIHNRNLHIFEVLCELTSLYCICNQQDIHGNTLLHTICYCNNENMLHIIFNKYSNIDISVKTIMDKTVVISSVTV